MNKFKLIGIGLLVVILIGMSITISITRASNKKLKAENSRLANNELQLLADNIHIRELILKKEEVTGKLRIERDSLAAALKIKPKQIEKIIYINNVIHDTTTVSVDLKNFGVGEWLLRDSSECFKYVSKLVLRGDSFSGKRQLFEYTNKTTQTFYKKRPHKFLFIKYGRWQYLQKIDATCGEVTFQSFTFLKE
jgi:hypothetical protein